MKERKYCSVIIFFYIVCVVSAESTENCTVKDHLPCMLYKGIRDCSRPALQTRFPFMYANDNWPGKVSSFNASITEDLYQGNQKYYSKGTFTFTPPQDGSIRLVKGFIVLRYRSDTTSVMCYVYDLSNATWKNGIEDYKTVFTLTLFPMMPNTVYLFDVYTLPKIPAEFDKKESLGVNLTVPPSRDDALRWTASISHQIIPERRELMVSFTAPPEGYHFETFDIILKNISGGARQFYRTVRTEHTFTDVVNGIYSIWVMPRQEACGCKDSKLVCGPCSTTMTANFIVAIATTTVKTTPSTSVSPVNSASTSGKQTHTDPKESEDTTRGHGDDNTLKVVLAVVGSFIGIMLVGCMFALLYFCKRKRRGNEKEKFNGPVRDADLDSMATVEQLGARALVNNYNAEKKKPERRPKLFILYEEDHPYHRKVVDKFAMLLQKHCSCDVMHAQLRLDTTWVHQESQNADYVLIVNSKLAYAIYQRLITKNRGMPERTPSGNVQIPAINCILERFLQEPHYDKTVMVYFDYTSEGLVIPDICPGYNYKLMKHFTDFLMHIHKLKRTDNLVQYDLPLDGKYYLNPVGKDLQRAIEEAVSYERENPDWFAQKYGYLRSFSNASDESGFDSGLPQEPIFLDPITANLQSYLDATSQDAITVTPPIITTKDSRQDLHLAPQSFQRDAYQSFDRTRPIHETPTTADSGGQFDFIPPDDTSEFETASKTQSEQMMSINARNVGYDNKAYDWQQDLNLLRVHNGEIPFDDSHSMGGESV